MGKYIWPDGKVYGCTIISMNPDILLRVASIFILTAISIFTRLGFQWDRTKPRSVC